MSKRSVKKAKQNPSKESEKAIVKILIQKIDDDIKIFCLGHEALSQDTMSVIEQFGNDLLKLDEVKANAKLHKEQNVPLFRVMLEKDDILLQTKYNLNGNMHMVNSIANIRNLISTDINKYVTNMMNDLIE